MKTNSLFREKPAGGATWVASEAENQGFSNSDSHWCNLGHGQPEVGPIAGSPVRAMHFAIEPRDLAYGPVSGCDALRETIAEHYNRLYRRDKRSRYGKENVCVAAGGRLVLSRILASLNPCRIGHLVPDYMGFEGLLNANSQHLNSIPIEVDKENGFYLPAERLESLIKERSLDALLFSNPCNPTGNLVRDEELDTYLQVSRSTGCWLLIDEFYSHFIFNHDGTPGAGPVSAAFHIKDIEADRILLVDGLTKNYRYPGLRLGWVVGPRQVIERISQAGSTLDGGASNILQKIAIDILQEEKADKETQALRHAFAEKRAVMIRALEEMGIRVRRSGSGTFYLWGDVQDLPEPLNDDEGFFREALKHKVVTMPGRFFDINPSQKRAGPHIGTSWMRFSFGPPMTTLQLALSRLAEMVRQHRKSPSLIL